MLGYNCLTHTHFIACAYGIPFPDAFACTCLRAAANRATATTRRGGASAAGATRVSPAIAKVGLHTIVVGCVGAGALVHVVWVL